MTFPSPPDPSRLFYCHFPLSSLLLDCNKPSHTCVNPSLLVTVTFSVCIIFPSSNSLLRDCNIFLPSPSSSCHCIFSLAPIFLSLIPSPPSSCLQPQLHPLDTLTLTAIFLFCHPDPHLPVIVTLNPIPRLSPPSTPSSCHCHPQPHLPVIATLNPIFL